MAYQLVSFTVPGEPRGKERPRFTRTGITYTPKATKDYQSAVLGFYLQAAHKRNLTESPMIVQITAYYGIPKSFSKKKRQDAIDGLIVPTKKPDVDNVAKCICDALNGWAYKDDSQIVQLIVSKRYSEDPRVVVFVSEQ